jgi:DNA-directed RNA polymerases I, II, and III subunit RPABC2
MEEIENFDTNETNEEEIEDVEEEKTSTKEYESTVISREEIEMARSKPKCSIPFLTKFERTALISERAVQIASGSPTTIVTSLRDPILIAEQELKERKIPLVVRRKFPDEEDNEEWTLSEFRKI